MKKKFKINKTVIMVLMSVLILLNFSIPSIYAADSSKLGTGFNKDLLTTATVDTNIEKVTKSITSTILTILQIAAVAGIVVCGIRYMFTSADQKADIKRSMIYLVIGCIIVFATSTVVQFVIDTFEQATSIQ